MSDCHRGDNSWADNFANNQNICFKALEYYYEKGFTYIELGDGDELWENKRFSDIREVHGDIYRILRKFHVENRLYMLWGNHDMVKKYPDYVLKNLYIYYDQQEDRYFPLFEGIKLHEGLILNHTGTGNKILLVHGHQGDLINDGLWRLGRFLVRNIWRKLETLGLHNPTSPAKNTRKRGRMEKIFIKWVQDNNQLLIAGHLHRPTLPSPGQTKYFNTGSCVHPRGITGIEIDSGEISLVKWNIKTKPDGTLYVGKDIISGPVKLHAYFFENKPLTV